MSCYQASISKHNIPEEVSVKYPSLEDLQKHLKKEKNYEFNPKSKTLLIKFEKFKTNVEIPLHDSQSVEKISIATSERKGLSNMKAETIEGKQNLHKEK